MSESQENVSSESAEERNRRPGPDDPDAVERAEETFPNPVTSDPERTDEQAGEASEENEDEESES